MVELLTIGAIQVHFLSFPFLNSDSEISLKIGQYLMKLRHVKLRRKKSAQVFWPPCRVVFVGGTEGRVLVTRIWDPLTYLGEIG